MKNFKFALFSMFMALFLITACTNDEPVDQPEEQTEESQSISNALDQLRTQFDANGNVTETDNPAGNIVLDFCFDFVYPLTLSYNNGTTVTVEDLDGLIDVMIASTNELYISGIAFPFDVETFNEDSDTIEVETIENEAEFIELLLSCEFDNDDIDECYEVYDPVCVEVTDPNGVTFIVTYPNECYAFEDGFTEEDFVDDCEEDYNCPGGNECFTFNFPLTIVTDNNETVTVNSQEELDNVLYDAYFFDFVYPFTVTVYDDDEEEIVTINSAEDLEEILEDCFDDYDGGNDDDCEECEDEPLDPVCVEYTTPNGVTEVIVFPNACFAECAGFDEEDFVECEDDNNPGGECDEEDLEDYLTECEWFTYSSLLNQQNAVANFSDDGSVTVEIDGTTLTGTWEMTSDPQSGQVFMFFTLPDPLDGVSSFDWTVVECDEGFISLISGNEFLGFEQVCD